MIDKMIMEPRKLPPWLALAGLPPMASLLKLLPTLDPEDRFIEMDDNDFFDEMDGRVEFIMDLYRNRFCQIQDRETDSDAMVQCDEHHPAWRLPGLV